MGEGEERSDQWKVNSYVSGHVRVTQFVAFAASSLQLSFAPRPISPPSDSSLVPQQASCGERSESQKL